MRTPRESLLFLSLLTVACLLVGVLIGIWTGNWAVPSPPAIRTPGPPAPTGTPVPHAAGDQRSLLLIGVDSADPDRQRLDACWVISYRPGAGQYYAISFRPTTPVNLASLPDQTTLEDVYAEDVRQQWGPEYTQRALQQMLDVELSVQAVLILSRGQLAALVDALDGLPLDTQTLTGEMLFARYDAWPPDNLENRLDFQNTLLSAIFRQLRDQKWSPQDLVAYFQADPSIRAEGLEAFAAEAPPFSDAELFLLPYPPPQAEDAAAP